MRMRTNGHVHVGHAATLIEEIELDRRLRDEVGMDARLFDEPEDGQP